MTLVVKLGSSVVVADDGSLRTDVLASVCAQVAELKRGGEDVVMVTSGAIARGIRLLELGARPSDMDALQAASAVGQGNLFRAYEERLDSEGVRAAQVLLTLSDVSERAHYLNARQTLRRLLRWGVVPIINENDTTATDEITFGRLHRRPADRPGGRAGDPDRRRLGARPDPDRRLVAPRPRRDGEQDHLGADRQRVGCAGGDLQRDPRRRACRGGRR
jgi:glutamate 5-kinase